MDEAKKMFLFYRGSTFFMAREGKLDKYREYNVSKEQELLWCREEVEKLKKEISKENNKCEMLKKLYHMESFFNIISKKESLMYFIDLFEQNKYLYDTATKIKIIIGIFNIIDHIDEDFDYKKKIVIKYVDELKRMKEEDITVSEDFYEDGRCPRYLWKDSIIEQIQHYIDCYTKEFQLD